MEGLGSLHTREGSAFALAIDGLSLVEQRCLITLMKAVTGTGLLVGVAEMLGRAISFIFGSGNRVLSSAHESCERKGGDAENTSRELHDGT